MGCREVCLLLKIIEPNGTWSFGAPSAKNDLKTQQQRQNLTQSLKNIHKLAAETPSVWLDLQTSVSVQLVKPAAAEGRGC